jgi:hypothetical protein
MEDDLENNLEEEARLVAELVEQDHRLAGFVSMGVKVAAFILSFCVVIVIFGVGKSLWPPWMVEYQSRIIGILLLLLFFIVIASPLMVEVTGNPRLLSAPGRSPKTPNPPEISDRND